PLNLDLRDATWEETLEAVRIQSRLNVVMNPELMANAPAKRVTIGGAGIPLSQVLDALRASGMACEWKDSALFFLPAEDGKVAPAAEPQRERSPLSGTAQPRPLDLPHRPGPAGAG
ncbi:MAG: hypothetical protein L6R48_21870, partial [Planctomycetes bacterium]|nr:hypothetical protein [Planctomycetota bacterium]